MRPFMNQHLTLEVAQLDKNGKPMRDKYSKPLVMTQDYPCATRVHGEEIRTSQLRVEDSRDEIDVMPDVPVQEGAKVIYSTITGEIKTGTILAISETMNLSGSKIYFRTCVVNG